MVTETYKTLKTGSMEQIFQAGLHEFLQNFMASNNNLSNSIARTYNFP
jgi:uncharacterized alpha-E superfamily protein